MPSSLKNHQRFWGPIAVYGDYLPWRVHKENGGDGSNYPSHSGRILDLKDGKAGAVTHFKDIIEPELLTGVAIATVPSHDPAKTTGGLKSLGTALASGGARIDATSCLVRTVKIAKLAHGGDRSKEVHLNSIVVEHTHLVKGKDVLLLDDVTTSGHSLEACTELLLKAGARSVQRAAIGLV